MKKTLMITGLLSTITLASCSSMFETDPVRVKTDAGDVVCQLYTRNTVSWDYAIDYPKTMNAKQADAVCFEAGYDLARER